jgi:hypothetical protein
VIRLFKFNEVMKLDKVPLAALIAIEFVAILLAVMPGLWVTQWREARVSKTVVENARSIC